MALHKIRWSKVYESSEEELIAFLHSRGISGTRVVNDGPTEATNHQVSGETSLWCTEGSMVVHIESDKLTLQPGDSLRLPAGIAYQIKPGISGCTYYETSTGGLSS